MTTAMQLNAIAVGMLTLETESQVFHHTVCNMSSVAKSTLQILLFIVARCLLNCIGSSADAWQQCKCVQH